jgi:hypothetical protein
VENASGDFLLIDILDEPLAHVIAAGNTPEHRRIMKEFADVAREFVEDNEINY